MYNTGRHFVWEYEEEIFKKRDPATVFATYHSDEGQFFKAAQQGSTNGSMGFNESLFSSSPTVTGVWKDVPLKLSGINTGLTQSITN